MFKKTCTICKETFPASTDYFHVHAVKNWRGLRPECKKCRKIQRHADYIKNIDKVAAQERARYRKKVDKKN